MNTDTPSLQDQVRQIEALLDRRRAAHARSLLRQALAEHPDDPALLICAARADLLDADAASAQRTLHQVLVRHPDNFEARALLLMLLTDEGDLVEAEQLALSLIAQYPQAADLYAAYGRVMVRALLFAKARALAQEALHMSPDNDFALRVLALCDLIELPRGTDSEALRRLLVQHPEDQHTLGLVVAALAHEGRHRAALRGARELLRAQPDDPHWLAVVRGLTAQNHWTLWPLWPQQRFGWGGVIALWVGFVAVSHAVSSHQPALAAWLNKAILGYVVYSWVWPPVLRRWLLR